MEQPEAVRKEPTEQERFEQLAKRLFAVPAEEIREKQAEYENGRREANDRQSDASPRPCCELPPR